MLEARVIFIKFILYFLGVKLNQLMSSPVYSRVVHRNYYWQQKNLLFPIEFFLGHSLRRFVVGTCGKEVFSLGNFNVQKRKI